MNTRRLSHFSFLAACVIAMSMLFPAGARGEQPAPVPDWGTTSTSILRIGWSSFTSTYWEQQWLVADDWLYNVTYSNAWEAHFSLPSGALITHISAEVYDNSDLDISLFLGTCPNLSPTCAFTPEIQTSGKPGYSWLGAPLDSPITVDNYANSYFVHINTPAVNGWHGFRSVLIRYNLQVSPAPATATFSDVPVGSMYHRFVEALYASGITAGCGSGKFCPNDPLTRGQMAIFLSAALGLHWPN